MKISENSSHMILGPFYKICRFLQISANICKYLQTFWKHMQTSATSADFLEPFANFLQTFANFCKHLQFSANICRWSECSVSVFVYPPSLRTSFGIALRQPLKHIFSTVVKKKYPIKIKNSNIHSVVHKCRKINWKLKPSYINLCKTLLFVINAQYKCSVCAWISAHLFLLGFQGHHLLKKCFANDHTSVEAKQGRYATYVDHNLVASEFRNDKTYKSPSDNSGNAETWAAMKDVILDPYFAPLMADDLSGLPNAYIITAQYDVLRDDGIMYGERLKKAGVKVSHHNYDRCIHTVFGSYQQYDISKTCMDDAVAYIKRNLWICVWNIGK